MLRFYVYYSMTSQRIRRASCFVSDQIFFITFSLPLSKKIYVEFLAPSHALVDYQLERGGMPLPDAVGVNCKKGATTENQGTGASYMG